MSFDSGNNSNSILSRFTSFINGGESTSSSTSPNNNGGYTYYQKKQEQLKRQQALQNKKRKFFADTSNNIGGISSHSSQPKPGTITKVRGAQYTLPINSASPINNSNCNTKESSDTKNELEDEEKDRRVSIETSTNRLLQVDEIKLREQINSVLQQINNGNNVSHGTTIATTTANAANSNNNNNIIGGAGTSPSLSFTPSTHTFDDPISKVSSPPKRKISSFTDFDIISNVKQRLLPNSDKVSAANTTTTTAHVTPDMFNYVIDDLNNSYEPIEMMNTGSKSSRNVNSSDLDDTTSWDPYDEILNQNKLQKFLNILNQADIDLEALRKLSWNGIPASVRALTWKLLLGYASCNAATREQLLQKKRNEYKQMVERFFNEGTMKKTEYENSLQRQIHIDVPRTNPDVKLFQQRAIQEALERILYIWSVRHPASGYVQGINDLVTPFMIVFLRDELSKKGDIEKMENILAIDVDTIDSESFSNMESDSFWCFTLFLDSIQDHYTFAQPGIQRMVHKLEEITRKIDEPLYNHIQQQGLAFIQFAFRWMNCLLMRELSLKLIIRIFDAYLAEGDGFEILHVYVCATFLKGWSERLRKLDFTEMVIFIQHLPTQSWTFKEIETILSRAYMLKVRYDQSNHL